jgi:diguanylate cyclase (GGDEF)-like protein
MRAKGAARPHAPQPADKLRPCLLGLLEAMPGVVMASRVDGRLLYLNAAGRALLGVGPSEPITSLRLCDFYSRTAYSQLLDHVIPACLRRGVWSGEIALRNRQREEIETNQVFIAHDVGQEEGGSPVLASIAWDIRSYKSTEQTLRRQATHDALTDCPNRALLMDRLAQAIHRAERRRRRVGVLFLDLNDFKQINDTFGHETANQVLREVAQRLKSNLRGEDTVARYGGDEFVLVVPDLHAASDVDRVTSQTKKLLDEPVVVNGMSIPVAASVGVALYPLDGEDPEALLRAADSAMYRVKPARTRAAAMPHPIRVLLRNVAARHGDNGAGQVP